MKNKILLLVILFGLTTTSTQAMFRTGAGNFARLIQKTNVIKKSHEKLMSKLEDVQEFAKIGKPLLIGSIFDIIMVSYIKDNYDQTQIARCESKDELKKQHKTIYKRYNTPRYMASKVSPKDVNLGGLIDQW